ncbi:sigma-54-dependent Fis family transcriptional regulator [Thalassotalea sp. HSM 43]|uniref:sigma-54-dependent transcriptional regulator n=1 Tax=Thalassotalea sp. HSM 43 TaxID=2552945 RepID=UPI00108030B5|nr:sigma-54 dependent transcriptional regulator [Thalassotalea sp. HSM 43]QBY05891.1 sigma-54-dependent Fis family transcriptional regulator [Thalassotalea sp. HSM 43]
MHKDSLNEDNNIQVLVVEDEPQQRQIIVELLQASNYSVLSADSCEQAIVMLKDNPVDVIFSDWKLVNLSGIDLLNYCRKSDSNILSRDPGFVIATAHGTISHAVEALQLGADDYLAKPFQRQELLLTIDKALKAKELRSQNKRLSAQLSEQSELVGLVGKAKCMQQVYQRINRVSQTNASILINGETGTGKELAARALHQQSTRHGQSFIAINCGAISESIAEAELFGAEKGAYTGATALKIGKLEAANKGTIFLDEIAELPLNLQVKLLRFLQEGCITRLGSHQEIHLDVRVIAATHRDLPEQVQQGRFREDLFYRLNVVPILMPPLRERQEDIPLLSEHFLTLHAKRHQLPKTELSSNALRRLLDYHWPGNVRELSNRLERYLLLDDESELTANTQLNDAYDSAGLPVFNFPKSSFNWEQFEKYCLAESLSLHEGNRTKAAKYLQMSYKAFLYRLEKYQLNG